MLAKIGRTAWTIRQGSLSIQFVVLAFFAVLATLLPFVVNDYWVRLGAFVLINIGLASSWNIIGGFAGYASFGHGVFFGLGAFVGAIGIVRFGLPLPVVMLLGGLVTGALALLFTPIFKQRGLYFALSTLAVLLVFDNVLQRWTFTRGLREYDVGWSVQLPYGLHTFYYIFLATVALLIGSVLWLAKSRIGYALHALRKDEVLASSIGIGVLRYKVVAFVFSAAWPGVLGAAFAPFLAFVSVQSVLDMKFTLNMILATIFGGAGTVVGPIIGAVALSAIDQFTWGNFLEYHRLIYGALIVGIIAFAPGGLVSIFWSVVRRDRVAPISIRTPGFLRVACANESGGGALMMNRPALLEVEHASRIFGGVVALKDVSFSVSADEVVGLIGPNGAGKTTLFNLISGLIPPSGGAIRLDGQSLVGLRPDQICARGAARTFQSASLLSGMTVWDNVHVASLFRTGEQMKALSALDCTRRALELCELDHLRDEFAETLSIGDQKRIEIARAVASDPKLLMTDEILAGLNPGDGEQILGILRKVRQRGISIIFVEHDVRSVMSLSDRVVVIAQGEKLTEGSPAEVARAPEVISVYLGARYAQDV